MVTRTVYIIGCGGIGGWVALNLVRLMPEDAQIILVDGDKFEEHNLDRQLFSANYVGMNKTKALKAMLCRALSVSKDRISLIPEFFKADTTLAPNSDVFVCVDNHKARAVVLAAVDKAAGCTAYFGANEYIDAEAYVYFPDWKGTALDPRVYYSDILTDKTGDPLTPPCSGEEQKRHPQLVTANMMSASYMMYLHYIWNVTVPKLTDEEAIARMPVLLRSNGVGRVETTNQGDLNDGDDRGRDAETTA